MSGLSQLFDSLHGIVFPYAGSTAPNGFLLCYGQAVSRTTYAALFATIGTTYGTGDGSTTFNLPDLRGRVVAGIDNMGGVSADRLLSSNSINSDRHTLGGAGGADVHQLTKQQMPSYDLLFPGKPNQSSTGIAGGSDLYHAGAGTTNVPSGGADEAHNIVQPTMLLNYIIKT